MTKVGVLGARGRMGREVIRAVTEAPDLVVAAEVDQGDKLDALARVRRGGRLHPARRGHGATCAGASSTAWTSWSARPGSARTGWTRWRAGWPTTRPPGS